MLNQLNSYLWDIFFLGNMPFFGITTMIEFDKMQIPSIVVMWISHAILVGLATIGVCVFCADFGRRIFVLWRILAMDD